MLMANNSIVLGLQSTNLHYGKKLCYTKLEKKIYYICKNYLFWLIWLKAKVVCTFN